MSAAAVAPPAVQARGAPLPNFAPAVHPPPFRLPAEHFVAALGWLAIGAAGLTIVAPDLAANNIYDPRVFSVTHCFTLGMITTTIFGALYQLFPVTMGREVRSIPLAHLTFWLLQTGTALVITGFWLARAALLGLGWVLVVTAVLLLGVNLISRGFNTQPDPLVGRYVVAGYFAMLAALGLASLRIGETLGFWQLDRLAMIASHFHLAAIGFASCVVVGVGSRMLPMFLVSDGHPRWPLRWVGPLLGAGLTGLIVGEFTGPAALRIVGGTLLGAAAAVYLWLGASYFRRRARRALDPGLAHVAVAFVSLGVAAIIGQMLLWSDRSAPRVMAAYALLVLVGWLIMLVLGVLYKVLPFLTWLHLFGARVGESRLPTVAELSRPAWGWLSLGFLAAGLTTMVAAVGAGELVWARLGAASFAAGVGLVEAQVFRVLRLRYLD